MIHGATLVKVGRGEILRELGKDERERVTRISELLAVSAMAGRRPFDSASYCNRDAFVAYIYSGNPETRHWTTISRGLYGPCINMHGREYVNKAHHVRACRSSYVDWSLFEALLKLLVSNRQSVQERVFPSVHHYANASTDSPTSSLGQDVVAAYGALQKLLGVRSKASELATKLSSHALGKTMAQVVPPDLAKHLQRKLQRSSRLPAWIPGNHVEAWIADLADVRNAYAHGATRANGFWTEQEHLVLLSSVFPQVLKRVLSGVGLYKLTKRDDDEVDALEVRLGLFPFRASVEDAMEDEVLRWVLAPSPWLRRPLHPGG